MPRPSTKASTRAVITFITAGMSTLKYGSSSTAESRVAAPAPVSIKEGNTAAPVRYESDPARIVEPYAIATVISSILPAEVPMSAMAVLTRPRIMRGMANPRNSPNIPLSVRKILTSHSGKNRPVIIPTAIAMTILPRRPILIVLVFSMMFL